MRIGLFVWWDGTTAWWQYRVENVSTNLSRIQVRSSSLSLSGTSRVQLFIFPLLCPQIFAQEVLWSGQKIRDMHTETGKANPWPMLVSLPIHFELFLLLQCYKIQRITLSEFGNQICERAKKFDANILEQSVRKISKNPEDSCKVYCATKTGEPITKSWTYPDGTMCHNYNSGDDDSSYFCVNGRCEVRPLSLEVNSIDDKLCLSFV